MLDICYCSAGLHEECLAPNIGPDNTGTCCCYVQEVVEAPIDTAPSQRPLKPDQAVKDITSTGRKRAAEMYPIEEGMTCEWAYLLFAGGGVEPIVGCAGTKLTPKKGQPNTGYIHHGPDKNTLNNHRSNIHIICGRCHNRWHTLNDQYYGKRPADGSTFLPLGGEFQAHDSETKADMTAIIKSEAWWTAPKNKRGDLR